MDGRVLVGQGPQCGGAIAAGRAGRFKRLVILGDDVLAGAPGHGLINSVRFGICAVAINCGVNAGVRGCVIIAWAATGRQHKRERCCAAHKDASVQFHAGKFPLAANVLAYGVTISLPRYTWLS